MEEIFSDGLEEHFFFCDNGLMVWAAHAHAHEDQTDPMYQENVPK